MGTGEQISWVVERKTKWEFMVLMLHQCPVTPLCSEAHILPGSSSGNILKSSRLEILGESSVFGKYVYWLLLSASSAAKEITAESTVDHQSAVYLSRKISE